MPGIGEGGATPEIAAQSGPPVTSAEVSLRGKVVQAKATETARVEEAKKTTESAAKPKESKLPQKVLKSEEFQKFREGAEKTQGKMDDEKALDLFYEKQAFELVGKELSNEIKNDPLFKQQVAQIRLEAQSNGKNLNPGEIDMEAAKRFLKIQDQRAEGIDPNENIDPQERIKTLEEQVENLKGNVQKMSETLQEVLNELQKKETDPKKKERWYALLLKIVAITGYLVVEQTVGKIVPRTN